MTGKELALTLVGAAVVGGAAGFAASYAPAPKEQAPALAPEVDARLKAADEELARTRAALAEAKKSLGELTERVTAAEIKAARQATDATADTSVPRTNGRRVRVADAKVPIAHGDAETALGDFQFGDAGGAIAVELDKALDGLNGQLGDVAGQIGAFRAGLDLRKLPEADRWAKAKEDLGLSWNEVEDLKKAVADRDAAMKDAMTKETKTGPNGGTITIQRPDAGKLAHADADYHDKLNATLGAERKKAWQSKGYDHAFGSSPFGGAGANVVMAIDVQTDKQGEAPKDAPK